MIADGRVSHAYDRSDNKPDRHSIGCWFVRCACLRSHLGIVLEELAYRAVWRCMRKDQEIPTGSPRPTQHFSAR